MANITQGNEKVNSKNGNILIGTQISGMGLEKMEHLTTSKKQNTENFLTAALSKWL
ncbi:MAG: hypothetical protein IKB25_14400 [Lentisphaeria bacterium]|nr:hypothetical protein [Lentisphaeria bacterium]